MADRILLADIVVGSDDPTAIKGEIANVMGVLAGLDVPGLFPVLEAQSFGVRALDADGQELIWILSSLEAADFAASGQPIEWLMRSLVQENTPAYRKAQADRIIGQVEIALRDLIDCHASERFGDVYLEHVWSASEVHKMRERANAERGEANDPRRILEYANLTQLRDAVVSRIECFDHGCLPESGAFRDSVTGLNQVRRKVAHHRTISEEDLRVCREGAQDVLASIGAQHPAMAADFLVDRWEERAAEIMVEAQRAVQSPTVPERGRVSEVEGRQAIVGAFQEQQRGIDAALTALGRLLVPAQRRHLHRTAVEALDRWRQALGELIAVTQRSDLTVSEAEAAQAAYKAALTEVRDLGTQIQQFRIGPPDS